MEETSYSPPPQDLAKILGRNNPAGKALQLLYNKDAAKSVGNTYHAKNKALHERKLANGWSPSPVTAPAPPKVHRPEIAVPKFTKKLNYELHAIDMVPRRKPMEQIRREIDDEYERMRGSPMPASGRAVLDDAEKERLAKLMRYRGKPPRLTEEELAQVKNRPTKKSERQQLEELFGSVLEEIEERRRFLQDLEAHGALKQDTVTQIRSEIQQRVTELDKIDKMLKRLDNVDA